MTLLPKKKNVVISRLRNSRSHKILSTSDSDDPGIKSMWFVNAIFNIYMLFEEIPLLANCLKRCIKEIFLCLFFFFNGIQVVCLYVQRMGSQTVN